RREWARRTGPRKGPSSHEGPFSLMLSADIVRPESARYATSLLCVPGLWAGAGVWRGFAGYLAHRGWESHLLDVRAIDAGLGELAPPLRRTVAANFAPESARVLREVMRPRTSPRGAGGVPALVVAGDRDPLLPPPMAAAFADALGAEHQPLAGAGHWLLAGVAWQRTVGLVHRWIVQRLGEPLLERYAEAMAERE